LIPAVPVTTARDLALIADVLAPWRARLHRIAVFGSRATGKARENSDYDLVLYGAIGQADIDRISTAFSESSLSVTADVVAYDLIRRTMLKFHVDDVARDLPLPWPELGSLAGQPLVASAA